MEPYFEYRKPIDSRTCFRLGWYLLITTSMVMLAPVTALISAKLEASESRALKQLPSGSTTVRTLPESLAA